MIRFRDWSLFVKACIPPLVVTIALIITAVLDVISVSRIETQVTNINDVVIRQVRDGLELKDAVSLFHVHLVGLISRTANTSRDPATTERLASDLLREAAALNQRVETIQLGDDGVEGAGPLRDLRKTFTQYLYDAQQAIDEGRDTPAYGSIWLGSADFDFIAVRRDLDILTAALEVRRQHYVEILQASERNSLYVNIAVAAAMTLAGLGVAYFMARQIAAPIERLTSTMSIMAGGDLAGSVPDRDRGDEVGTMATALDTFRAGMIQMQQLEAAEFVRKQAEREAHRNKVWALGELAGGIAHDFNNLLATMQMNGEILMGLLAGSHHAVQVKRIVDAGLRGQSLVKRILSFSRRESVGSANIRLADIVEECTQLLATLPATTRLKLGRIERECVVAADHDRLVQVVFNLCINASDSLSGQPGDISIDVEALATGARSTVWSGEAERSSALSGAGYVVKKADRTLLLVGRLPATAGVVIRVSDTGCGISPGVLDKIFVPFYTTKEMGNGTGLGLAIVHNAVLSYGGAIIVSTREGAGTTFEIILPAATGAVTVATEGKQQAQVATERRARVLVVDDDVELCETLHDALVMFGHEATAITDPFEAARQFRERPDAWDVVLLDQTMPGMKGDTLVREMRSQRPMLPIIMCTGYAKDFGEAQARSLGVNAYLTKPIVLAALPEALEMALSGRTMPEGDTASDQDSII